MSNKDKLKLDCLTDFQRAAALLYTNPQTDGYRVFFDHGVKLLRKLNLSELIKDSSNIERMIVNKDLVEYTADKILMLGILASQDLVLRG